MLRKDSMHSRETNEIKKGEGEEANRKKKKRRREHSQQLSDKAYPI